METINDIKIHAIADAAQPRGPETVEEAEARAIRIAGEFADDRQIEAGIALARRRRIAQHN